MNWGDTISVSQAVNGFIVEAEDFLQDDTETLQVYLFEEEDQDEHVVSVLYEIVNHFGIFYSKHKRRNLVIEWREEDE